MKKLSVFMALALAVCLLAGCAGTPVIYYTDCTCPVGSHEAVQVPAETQKQELPAEGALKIGLAVDTNVQESKSATAEENGEGKYAVTVAAVLVDDNGIIRDCIIDGIAASVKFDATGTVTTDLTAAPKTKNELGPDYNMVTYGGAIAEWDEQAASFASYVIGKTAAEVAAIAVNEATKPTGEDLKTSVTIAVGDFQTLIQKAVANAQHLGAQSGDALKMAVITSISDSKSADAENAGTAQLNVDVTALTLNGETITSCVIDAVQAKVSFDASGAVTSDITAPVATKNELGDAYNMVAYGGAIAEWNQQAASFAAYVTGKTAAEVAGIAVDEGTKPTGEDLKTSVTIAVGGFQALIQKAAQ